MTRAHWLLAASVLVSACEQPQDSTGSTDAGELAKMYEDIYALTEDRTCAGPAECAAAGLGAKPCGGPSTYVVYATPNVDEDTLQEKADALAEYERRYNAEHGALSDCSVTPPPDPDCQNQVCVDRAAD